MTSQRQSSCPLGVSIKGIGRAFNWLKCLGGFLHLKPTAWCQISTLIFWYLTPCCGLEVQKPTQVLQLVKGTANTFGWRPKWVRTLLSLIYLSWDIYRDPLQKRKFKYQRTSIKSIGRAFNWLKCLGGFLHPKPTTGCQISTLIFEFSFLEGVYINILWNIWGAETHPGTSVS
jgi:hypothetical protein